MCVGGGGGGDGDRTFFQRSDFLGGEVTFLKSRIFPDEVSIQS